MACHCYHIELRRTRAADAYPIEGLDTRDDLAEQQGELAKDLISIPLADGNLEHTVQIGSNLDQVTKNQLISFFLEKYRCLHLNTSGYARH